MARINCECEIVELDGDVSGIGPRLNDFGGIEGVVVTCSRCGNWEESYGTSEASVRRCCALLREGCPLGESNFYSASSP